MLPEKMLVNYENAKDPQYPRRLAEKIREACNDSQVLRNAETSRMLAIQHFDYALLASRLSAVLAAGTKNS